MVTKYMRKGSFYLLNTKLDELAIQTCVKNVLADGTNTILLVKEYDIDKLRRSLSANLPVPEPNLAGSSERDQEVSLERPARRRRPRT
jgi:hypothetical protein